MPNRSEALFPIIVQDADTRAVLMLAYGNKTSLERTRKTGWMHYWSRSRNGLWRKGESSGNAQRVISLKWDCDHDTLLAKVRPTGPSCHTGTYTCFGEQKQPPVFPDELWKIFQDREKRRPKNSYVARLLANQELARKKVGEEAVEFILASQGRSRRHIISEAADLFFHTLVLLYACQVPFEEVQAELRRRRV